MAYRVNLFQFPPPRGGEQDGVHALDRLDNFNSRPREGANFFLRRCEAIFRYFNSRPREGANEVRQRPVGHGGYFNSRPREGANV